MNDKRLSQQELESYLWGAANILRRLLDLPPPDHRRRRRDQLEAVLQMQAGVVEEDVLGAGADIYGEDFHKLILKIRNWKFEIGNSECEICRRFDR